MIDILCDDVFKINYYPDGVKTTISTTLTCEGGIVLNKNQTKNIFRTLVCS